MLGLPKNARGPSLHQLAEQLSSRAKEQPHQMARSRLMLSTSNKFAWRASNLSPKNLLFTTVDHVDRQPDRHPRTKDHRPLLRPQHKSLTGQPSIVMALVPMTRVRGSPRTRKTLPLHLPRQLTSFMIRQSPPRTSLCGYTCPSSGTFKMN